MQYVIKVDQQSRTCHIHVTGRMEAAEYESAIEAFLNHPDVEPGMPAVYDLREAQMSHLHADAFRAMAAVNAKVSARRGKALVAIVVSDAVHFGLARMYEVLGASPNLQMRVFADAGEATRWAAGALID